MDALEARDEMDEEEVAKTKGDPIEVVQSEIEAVEKWGATKDAGVDVEGAEEDPESGLVLSPTILSGKTSKMLLRVVEEKAARIELVVGHEVGTQVGIQEAEMRREVRTKQLSHPMQ